MKTIETNIDIAASRDRVWTTLTDLKKFPEWNPFITSIEGDLEQGSRLLVTISPPGRKAMIFKPYLIEVEAGMKLSWLGHFLVPGLFDGRHEFIIAGVSAGKLQFIHREEFTGLLVPLFWGSMEQPTKTGFESMNEALKKRAETAGRDGESQ